MPKPIQITSADDFATLLQGLANDIVNANIHFRLYQDLNASIAEYCTELNQSPTFWNLTISAQLDATLVRLCRAFDSQKPALSLSTWLATIASNLEIFDTPNFKERLSDNPFVESLASEDRTPSKDQLDNDSALVSSSDSLVKKLLRWRNNVGAHRSPLETISPNSAAGPPLEFDEIQTLLERANAVLNRYSQLFQAVTFSVSMVGADDYKYVLNSIRDSVLESKRKFEKELAKYGEESL